MKLPAQSPNVRQETSHNLYSLSASPTRNAGISPSWGGGGGGGGSTDSPASCAVSCSYCAPNQRCNISTYCQNRYKGSYPWGCYY